MKTKIDLNDFRVGSGDQVKLKRCPTRVRPFYKSKEHYETLLDEHTKQLRRLQDILYAQDRFAVLIIFQALDAAGKDGAIKHVMSGVNPQGCQVYSFKEPSRAELDHDFLWRTNISLPERGRLGIFNRSYYEEVLVVRVHPEWLEKQNLPAESLDEKKIWKGRFRSIVDLEQHLHRNGTRIIKFYLHLSKEEQRKRLLSRVEDSEKNWKVSLTDVRERQRWKDYMKAYEACLNSTSTDEAPWYVVPADDKQNARLIISEAILNTLRGLKMDYPKPTKEQRASLKLIRKQLSSD